jgi:hypothetical protein
MSKKLLLSLTGVLLLVLVFAGCQRSINGPTGPLTEAEKQQITQTIASDPLFTSDASTLNDDGAAMALGKTEAPIYPRAWGRKITSVDRLVEFETPNDTTTIATVTHTIAGNVIIRAKYSLQDTGLTTITKPFTEVTVRKIKFYRNPFAIGPRWLPREVSAVKGGTQGSLVTVTQVRVIMGTDTITITDPLNYFLKLGKFGGREVPTIGSNFLQNITVQVSVTSADPDTDIVTLHRPFQMMGPGIFKPLAVRMQMVSQTQNGGTYARVYEKSWVGVIPGRHHVFVGALTRSSIFDDAATFSSQLWGVPYIVN